MYRRFPAYLLLVLCLISSCKRGNRVIPKDKFAEIYAEMFVLDQWLDDNREVRRRADTTLVYAPVLDKYGYTYDDYLASVDKYMKDPMRYSRILRSTAEILNNRLENLKTIQAEELAKERAARRLDSLIRSVNFDMDSVLMAMMRVHPTDSIVAVADSDGFLSFRFVCVSDTVYDGPAMVFADSLELAKDSLETKEVIHVTDSTTDKNPEIKLERKPLKFREKSLQNEKTVIEKLLKKEEDASF